MLKFWNLAAQFVSNPVRFNSSHVAEQALCRQVYLLGRCSLAAVAPKIGSPLFPPPTLLPWALVRKLSSEVERTTLVTPSFSFASQKPNRFSGRRATRTSSAFLRPKPRSLSDGRWTSAGRGLRHGCPATLGRASTPCSRMSEREQRRPQRERRRHRAGEGWERSGSEGSLVEAFWEWVRSWVSLESGCVCMLGGEWDEN